MACYLALPLLNGDSTIELAVPLADTDCGKSDDCPCLAEHGIYVAKVNEQKNI